CQYLSHTILSLGWSCAGIEPVLQHVPPQFFSIRRVSSSACGASVSSACAAPVLRDFSTSALHPLEKWLIPCCFALSNAEFVLHQLVWLSSMSGSASAKSAVLN